MINPEKIKCQIIKKLIEETFYIEDAGTRTRKRPHPEVKKIYSSLCKEFTKASLDITGEVLGNYSHCNVLYLSNSFNDLRQTKGLDFLKQYNDLHKKLTEEQDLIKNNQMHTPFSIKELIEKNRIVFIKICAKYRSVISTRDSRIQYLENLLKSNQIKY
jgi:hypothetical protein